MSSTPNESDSQQQQPYQFPATSSPNSPEASTSESTGTLFGRFLNTFRPPLNRTYTAQDGIRGNREASASNSSLKSARSKRRNSSPTRPGSVASASGSRVSPPATSPYGQSLDSRSLSEYGSTASGATAYPAQSIGHAGTSAGSGLASGSNSQRPKAERRSSSKRLAAAISRPLFRRSSSVAGSRDGQQQQASLSSVPSLPGGLHTPVASTSSAKQASRSRPPSSLASGPPSPATTASKRPFTASSMGDRSQYSLAQSTPSPGIDNINLNSFPSPFFAQATPTSAFPNPFSPPVDCVAALTSLLSNPITLTLSQLIPLNLIGHNQPGHGHTLGGNNTAGLSTASIATSALSEAATSSTHHTTSSSAQTPASSSFQTSTASIAHVPLVSRASFVSNEQLAASSLNLPTTAVATVWRIARALEWVGENGSALNALVAARQNPMTPRPTSKADAHQHSGADCSSAESVGSFDFAALVQSVADVLAATASEQKVDLIVYHGAKTLETQQEGTDFPKAPAHQASPARRSRDAQAESFAQNRQPLRYDSLYTKEAFVTADERGLGVGLMTIIKQVIAESRAGGVIEIGLNFTLTTPPQSTDPASERDSERSDTVSDSALPTGTYLVALEIKHTFPTQTLPPLPTSSTLNDEPPAPASPLISHKAVDPAVSAALLQHLRISLVTLPAKDDSQTYKVTCALPQGQNPVAMALGTDPAMRRRKSVDQGREPSLYDLSRFVETTLRGKKAQLHAQEQSAFARHLTHHLSTWGLDVNHVSTHQDEDGDTTIGCDHLSRTRTGTFGLSTSTLRPEGERGALGRWDSGFGGSDSTSPPNPLSGQAAGISPGVNLILDPVTPYVGASSPAARSAGSSEPGSTVASPPLDPQTSFIIIDDDVPTLKRQLISLRNNAPNMHIHNALLAKRPQLQSRRTRSSHAIQRVTQVSVSIIHFTTLSNYRQIKEVVHSILKNASPMFPLPEVLVVPKPVGPRRLLTTLYNAVKRPALDPYFVPIATSPSSPGGHYFFAGGRPSPAPSHNNQNDFDIQAGQMLAGGRPAGDAGLSAGLSQVQGARTPPVPNPTNSSVHGSNPPSPASPDAIEYFGRAAAELSSTKASSGIVIQSPDGRPAGLFFQPRAASLHEKTESIRMARQAGDSNGAASDTASQASSTRPRGSPALGSVQLANISQGKELPSIVIPENMDIGTSGRSLSISPSQYPASEQGNNSFGQRAEALAAQAAALSIDSVTHVPPRTKRADSPSTVSSDDPQEVRIDQQSTSATASPKDTSSPKAAAAAGPVGSASPRRSVSRTPAPGSPTSAVTMADEAMPAQQTPTAASPSSDEQKADGSGIQPQPTSPLSPMALKDGTVLPVSPVGSRLARRKEKVRKPPRRPTGSLVPPISVLIVEDNPINQIILSTFLKKKGIKYNVANNGQEAVDRWKAGDFHLVLMDIQLPVKDGIEATREIRALERARATGTVYEGTPTSEISNPMTSPISSPYELPVIIFALTASNLQSDRVTALAAGCNDFLTKPVSLQWLNQKLVEWGSMAYLSGFSHKRRNTSASTTPFVLSPNNDAEITRNLSLPNVAKAGPDASRVSERERGVSVDSKESAVESDVAGETPVRNPMALKRVESAGSTGLMGMTPQQLNEQAKLDVAAEAERNRESLKPEGAKQPLEKTEAEKLDEGLRQPGAPA